MTLRNPTYNQTLKKKIVNSEIFDCRLGRQNLWITKNLKLQQNSLYQIFNPNAFFIFFLTVAIWYYHAIQRVFKYFASFTAYEDDIFYVIYYSHDQEFKFGGYIYKFGKRERRKKDELRRVHGVCFFQVCL